MILPTCGGCGRPCIPMADYDVPTCIACDVAIELISMHAGRDLVPAPPRRVLAPCGTRSAAARHRGRGEPVDAACEAAEREYNAEQQRRRRERIHAA